MMMTKSSFLLPMLMEGGLGGMDGGTDMGLSMLKYKMLLGDTQASESNDTSEDQYMKLYMFVPAAKQMVQKIAEKLTEMPEETKNKIVAASIMKTLADNMLADTPEDELALTLQDVADEMIMQFVFTNQMSGMIKDRHEQKKMPSLGSSASSDSGSVGGKLLSERKIGEDAIRGILVDGKREEPRKIEDKSAVRKRANEARKNKKALARKAGEGESVAGSSTAPF
jgi:hypothetical protein